MEFLIFVLVSMGFLSLAFLWDKLEAQDKVIAAQTKELKAQTKILEDIQKNVCFNITPHPFKCKHGGYF